MCYYKSMSISNDIKQKIFSISEGHLFSFKDFQHIKNDNIVALVLSRLCKEKVISRISKGLYYRPITDISNTIPPEQSRIISSLNDGYVSGIAGFNKLGLTQDSPKEIVIMGRRCNRKTTVGTMAIRYRKKNASLKTRNVELLQILDALKEIKTIPGTTIQRSVSTLKVIITSLKIEKRLKLVSLCLRYPPLARALLGAILEEVDPQASEVLKGSLNLTTNYRLGDLGDALSNQKKWRII